MLLANIGVTVLPAQLAVAKVNTLMDNNGVVTDEKTIKQLKNLGKQTAELTMKMTAQVL
jgi:hypothetical protein